MKHVYLVDTRKGTYKMTSEQVFDLITAQKALRDMGGDAEIFFIRELTFFEKVVDKLRNR